MEVIEKILVLIESVDQAKPLLSKARRLALACDARLELYSSCYCQSLNSSYLFDHEGREHAKHGYLKGVEKWLDGLIQPLLDEGIDASFDVSWARHVDQGMLTKIERYEPDLVIKDCRYHHRIDQHIFGHVDWELIRNCSSPLLLVRPKEWQIVPRIVAAVDPIQGHEKTASMDMKILASTRMFNAWVGGEVTAFHSYQPLPMSVIVDDTLIIDYEEFKAKQQVNHQQAMEDLMEQFGFSEGLVPVYLAEGEPHQVLPEYLEQHHVDLVVLGAVERGALDRFFVGSTSEMALDHIPCDVLIVKDKNRPA